MLDFHNKRMAIKGLTSYRYSGRYGFIMIGATDNTNALNEAQRSCTEKVSIDKLEVWNGSQYERVQNND